MTFSPDFLVHKFLQHAGYPKYKSYSNVYEAGCPICREGKSWGKKRRLYYILRDNKICCHNCGWYGSPVDFVIEITNVTFKDLVEESKTFTKIPALSEQKHKANTEKKALPSLPDDSINLFDGHQVGYYDKNDIVKEALSTVVERRLNSAVNRPKSLWISLTDFVHKNRIIIPFYDETGKIIFYQTRSFNELTKGYPKYLSKSGAEKSLFNVNEIDSNESSIFIFEGPIDACFVKNGVAVAGIQENSHESLTTTQQQQLGKFLLHNQIWVLDSQWQDNAALNKSMNLIEQGKKVFLWPKSYGEMFKDFNDMCVKLKRDEISSNFILQHTYAGNSGLAAINKLRLRMCS